METPNSLAFEIHHQSLKTLKFKSFGPVGADSELEMDIAVDIQAEPYRDSADLFGVVLQVKADANAGENAVFSCEVDYVALVKCGVQNDAERNELILVQTPHLMFPYVRRIISNITQDAGFEPLMLNPIDFAALFQAQSAKSEADDIWKLAPSGHG